MQTFLYAATTIGSIILLLVLLYIFGQNYRRIRSEFTLGLLLFAIILLFNTIFSSHLLFVGGEMVHADRAHELSHSIASTFEFIALLVLLYIVRK